ncbi:3-deoxy-manno-octulosonate cytidylyltransferase [Sphingomonas glaciei]|uniref:3-deoxy-manno-octulosonate cytidylyltransferase n=1 Tax=Sphingomonas glaciei TaxID=2938948 RepID=A0ABY5MWE0_9SPHN|nr:3-deoxy-manno-octulosonate cytidylyltransferase [Sphingomonas glaciei]UUR08085.1 3-deoxy-manno-octulosonate cytidylyltransferase [Sphingomonas glaciei]
MAADFAVLIPARFASTRFPGKPLIPLRGATGLAKTLVQRSWECARQIEGCSGLWVATDDDRIAEEVERFGGSVVMTSPDCANGTERCADALAKLDCDAEFIVNLQGDAPLSPGFMVPELVARLAGDLQLAMATAAIHCNPTMLEHLQADEAAGRVGGTTAVFDGRLRALYFSKRILPYLPQTGSEDVPVFMHLGLYAYRRAALLDYAAAEPSVLERAEGLEQLRFLDLGLPVGVCTADPLGWDPIELNNPSDVPAIERLLAERNLA